MGRRDEEEQHDGEEDRKSVEQEAWEFEEETSRGVSERVMVSKDI